MIKELLIGKVLCIASLKSAILYSAPETLEYHKMYCAIALTY